jgi:UDP-N-acetylglucosamine diphosphorylase/glucosamine-1-phosphate N-acetyltransferase
MKIVIFEDEGYLNLLPTVYFQPVWNLHCGIDTLIQKVIRCFGSQSIHYMARDYISRYFLPTNNLSQMNFSGEVLFVNGRILLQKNDNLKIKEIPANSVLKYEDAVVAVRVSPKKISKYFQDGVLLSDRVLNDFSYSDVSFQMINFPWDLIYSNGTQIRLDASELKRLGNIEGLVDAGVQVLGKENIYIGKNSRVMPGVVINAEDGPVWIADNCLVMAQAVLEGPLFVGNNSKIKASAKIYPNTSIGEVCKIGGEVEDSIIQSYSNKQHEGFLGHSYLGSWINIGADTNNSDLKNNYGEINIYLHNRTVATGKQFLGVIMGDHTKTAINTMINTGSVIGACCNIFGGGFPPKYIPSFSWGGSEGLHDYKFEKCIEVSKVVLKRRNIEFSDNHLKLFESVKNLSLEVENRARIKRAGN